MATPTFPHSSPDTLQREVATARAQESGGSTVKYTKDEVNYRDAGGSSTKCGYCKFYQGTGICSQVEGKISPNAVCDLYKPGSGGMSDLIAQPRKTGGR